MDDEVSVRALARRMLEHDGCQVHEAADGLQALAVLAERGGVDVVVSDLRMPNVDGWSLAVCLANWIPRIPIVIISGYDIDLDEIAAFGPVLAKPFSAEQLIAAVRQVLERQAQSA